MSTLFTDVTAAGTNRDAGEFTPEEAVPRVDPLGWQRIGKELDEQGSSLLPGVLSREECQALAGVYPEDGLFRSRVVMGRHGFGRGEYKYFCYPLPQVIQELRTALYSRLAPVANGSDPRHCFCNMAKVITTVCTRTSTENMSSQYR